MKKEASEDIENTEKDNDITDEKGNSEESSTENNDSDKDSEETSDDKDEETSSGKNTVLIVELLIAAAAVIFIVFALISNNKDNTDSVSNNNVATDNATPGGDIGNPDIYDIADIDNSILYENIPALPEMSELNTMTEAEAEAFVADGTMLKLELADGGFIYINNYTDIDYISEQVIPTDEEVDDAIYYNITYYYIETTEGSDHTTVEDGDIIIADYVGELDGVAFDGGSAANIEIMVGTGGYIPGFEEGFIGMEIGETKEVPITFPENYNNTDLAGKDVIFTFVVNEITGSYTIPELTDEMVLENFYDGSATNVQECREYFKTMMLQDNIWDFIIDKYYVTSVSEESVLSYYNMMMESYDQMSIGYQISVADMLAYSGASVDDLKADTILSSCYTAIEYSIFETIANNEGITVTDEDINALAADYGYTDTDSFVTDFGEDIINEYLLQEKVLDYIVSLL